MARLESAIQRGVNLDLRDREREREREEVKEKDKKYMMYMKRSNTVSSLYSMFMVPCIIIFYEITNRCSYMQSILCLWFRAS